MNQERAEPIENSFGVFVNRVDVRPVHSTSKPAGLLRLAAKNLRQLHVDLADRGPPDEIHLSVFIIPARSVARVAYADTQKNLRRIA